MRALGCRNRKHLAVSAHAADEFSGLLAQFFKGARAGVFRKRGDKDRNKDRQRDPNALEKTGIPVRETEVEKERRQQDQDHRVTETR